MKIKLIANTPITTNIHTFTWEPERPVNYIAGQFIEMTIKHPNPDERGTKHWFTLSSSPTEKLLANTTKYAGDDKSSSFKKSLFGLQPGQTVEINDPEGDFTLPEDKKLELVFIAGGIGITPFRSMTKWLTDTSEKRSVTLIHGVQTAEELVFHDLFKAYGATVVPVVGQRLSAAELMKEIGNPAGKLVYVSGPEPMVEALHDQLIAAGLPEAQLKTDYFPGYENLYSR